MTERRQITLRASREQLASIDAAARKLGLARNDYMLIAALNRAGADSDIARIEEALQAAEERLSMRLAADLDASVDRTNKNLRSITDWMQKRWPAAQQERGKAQ